MILSMQRLFLYRLIAIVAAGVCAVGTSAAEAEKVSFIGYLTYDYNWNNDLTPRFGFYRFTTDAADGITPIASTIDQYENVGNSGVYANGKYYCINVSGSYREYESFFKVYDATTWELEKNVSLGKMNDQTIAGDLTYDHTTGTLYASTRPFGNTDSGWLCSVDTETGEFTRIASTGFMCGLAADAYGQLWGISNTGTLCKINKNTGAREDVGPTGYQPNDITQSATFDYRSNRLFWVMKGFTSADTWRETSVSALMEVDLTTGAATVVVPHYNDEQICALGIVNSHPEAPDRLADLQFAPTEPMSQTARLQFTVPDHTYHQAALSGSVGIEISLDGVPYSTTTAEAGSTFSVDIPVAEAGNHTVDVALTANGQRSVINSGTNFFGADTPTAPANVSFTLDALRHRATIAWDAPTAGTAGGYIDPASVTYQVVIQPSGRIVADGITATSFTDDIAEPMGNVRYYVTATAGGQKSARGYSEWQIAGQDRALPWRETFDSQAAFDNFFTIDANGDDNGDSFYNPVWHWDNEYYAAFYFGGLGNYGYPADDWLITPAMAFDGSKVYRLAFDAYGYNGYDNHLVITLGEQPTVEGQSRVLSDRIIQAKWLEPVRVEIDFVAEAGQRYVGFHNLTTVGEHLSIDNITITEVSDGGVPASIADATATETAQSGVTLHLTMPTKTATGQALSATEPLSLTIYKGVSAEPIDVVEDLTPGEAVEWDDPAAIPGYNSYTLTASNSVGSSIAAEVVLDLGEGIPGAPQELQAEVNANGYVVLTWEAPEDGVDEYGRTIVGENASYRVTRVSDAVYTTVADNLRTTTFTDTNPGADLTKAQGRVYYRVEAFCPNGTGESAITEGISVGSAYPLPFAETWLNQTMQNTPWVSEAESVSWSVVGTGYDPFVLGIDGAGMLKCECGYYSNSGSGYYLSPQIDFSRNAAPTATIQLYCASTYNADTYVQLGYQLADGTRTMLADKHSAKADSNGWQAITADLTGAAGESGVKLVIFANIASASGNNVYLDQLTITGSTPASDLRVAGISGLLDIQPGVSTAYTVTVENIGSSDFAAGSSLVLYANGNTVDTVELPAIAAGCSHQATVHFTATDRMALSDVTLHAAITTDDELTGNNHAWLQVAVGAQNLPWVSSLRAEHLSSGSVEINWGEPDRSDIISVITDDVESYDAFAIDNVGRWLMEDDDLLTNAPVSANGFDIAWPNCDELQAFIVFAPEQTTPAVGLSCHSGKQAFAVWQAYGDANDDWLISPELDGSHQTITFYGRAVAEDVAEQFNVHFSRDGENFIQLNQMGALTASSAWQAYHFALPEGTVRFAIQYTGFNALGMLFDDFQYTSYSLDREPTGYNVYRNGELIYQAEATEHSYSDSGLSDGTYSYTVCAVYDGAESRSSASAEVTVQTDSAIDAAEAADFTVDGGTIRFEGEGRVYGVDGRLLYRGQSVTLAPGCYVVATGTAVQRVVIQ